MLPKTGNKRDKGLFNPLYNSHGLTWFFTVVQPTTNNETKDINNAGLKWAPQALRPLVSCILFLVSYKNNLAGAGGCAPALCTI